MSGDVTTVSIDITELSLYTHHGVTEAEREVGQRLELSVGFEVPDCDAILTDRVEDTVDYGEVVALVERCATERSYKTLERLCHVIACEIAERWDNSYAIRVYAAKPEPPLAVSIGSVGVEVRHEVGADPTGFDEDAAAGLDED